MNYPVIGQIEDGLEILFCAPMSVLQIFRPGSFAEIWCISVYSEMTSSEAIIRQKSKSIGRDLHVKVKGPWGSINGLCPANLTASALFLQERYRPELIDVNFGCPEHECNKNGCGANFKKNPN